MARHVIVKGLHGCAEALRALPKEISGKNGGPLRGATFSMAKIIRDAARTNAPRGVGTPMPGNLKRQIFAYRDRNPKASTGANERYIIDVRTGKRGKRKKTRQPYGEQNPRSPVNVIGGDAYYWFFVEFGTRLQPPQRFMTRAFEENKVLATEAFAKSLQAGIPAAIKRAAALGKRRGR